ncbi:MAG TPA: penicillin acylase family protein [Gemmatimonadaceae bacterium]
MRASPLRASLALLVFCGLLALLSRPLGPAPALGPLLDPARGVWATGRGEGAAPRGEASIPGLAGPVRVVYDDRDVPHIFASRVDDAIRVLGYVVARDRLVQLQVQTLAASGRLTEIAGARALPLDQEMRGLGLPRNAERIARETAAGGIEDRFTRAYADGVNAWIASITPARMPLELRLLGIGPARWEPVNTAHLMNRMMWTLASYAPERDRAPAASMVGAAAAASLFPEHTPIQQPIEPNGSPEPRFAAARIVPPGRPDSGARVVASILRALAPATTRRLAAADPGDDRPSAASNNWAVAPARSATGHALLAGDPHLELTLPSIWYEVHLVVPGELDVYGVTIPGAPGVLLGMNRDVAWSSTNTGADVMDFYAERVDDVDHPTRTLVDGAWHPVERRVERYRGRRGEVIATDTVLYSHRGPMRREGDRWLSMRWTALESGPGWGSVIEAYDLLARATSARGALDALDRFAAPAQNFVIADRQGTIAVRSNGRFPVRPGDGSGMVIRDGSTSASDWTGDLRPAEYPQAVAPAQGYVATANQDPWDPATARGYLGVSIDPWRAMRINRLLRADSQVTVDAMRRWQTDPGSERAELFVPAFLRAASRCLAAPCAGVDTTRLREGARLLGEWARRYTRDDRRAILFELAMRQLTDDTFEELVPAGSERRVVTPSSSILATLLRDSTNAWWDDRRTAPREDRDAVLARALGDAVRQANVRHLLQIPALGALGLSVQGGPSTLSPLSGTGTHGASWRMVVELGPELEAWGTYPGGQTGDPTAPGYRDRLPLWLEGRLAPLQRPRSAADAGRLPGARTVDFAPRGAR